jgi:outer membrane immunogenic protein
MWLIGIEAYFQGANIKGSNREDVSPFFGPGKYVSFESRLKWFGTARGRLG